MSLLELLPCEGVTLPDLPDYTPAEIIAAELDSLGMALSGHPLTCVTAKLQKFQRVLLAELGGYPAEYPVTVAGVIIGRSRRRVRGGGMMSTLLLSDESGLAEVVLYPDINRRLLARLDVNGIMVKGRINTDGDGVIAEDVTPLAALPE